MVARPGGAAVRSLDGDKVDLYNIRNSPYRTTTDFTVRHYNKTFDLNQVASVDFTTGSVQSTCRPEGIRF